jgi:hypothetical protein
MSVTPMESRVVDNLARILARKVTDYLQDPVHKREFENWYRQKYGKEYEWR